MKEEEFYFLFLRILAPFISGQSFQGSLFIDLSEFLRAKSIELSSRKQLHNTLSSIQPVLSNALKREGRIRNRR